MARPARILLAGTTAATALFAAAATSAQQAQVLNNQLQLGDVVAGQTLNVVTTSDQVTASTTATGAQLAGGVQGGDLQVTSRQEMQGNAAASTRLDISGEVGGPVSISTQATGTDAQLTVDGGTMTADLTQVAGAVTVGADSHVEAVAGRMLGGGSISSTAMA
ncbi:MAG TPA: holdfast attachment protein D, partial [Caulobacteraceae bacterium]